MNKKKNNHEFNNDLFTFVRASDLPLKKEKCEKNKGFEGV
jgi:hypothetical protein